MILKNSIFFIIILNQQQLLPIPSSAPAAPGQGENPKEWGQFMSQSSDGKGSYYEQNNKDGSITLTHVRWTDERAAKCPQCDHRYHDND